MEQTQRGTELANTHSAYVLVNRVVGDNFVLIAPLIAHVLGISDLSTAVTTQLVASQQREIVDTLPYSWSRCCPNGVKETTIPASHVKPASFRSDFEKRTCVIKLGISPI